MRFFTPELPLPISSQPEIRLARYDRAYLDKSWEWLRDPEIKALTMASDFTREEQLKFFDELPSRPDYKIWGVESPEGIPIGAAGIKKIVGHAGEFWCYMGDREWWGRGLGGRILELCEVEARSLGLDKVTMIAAESNLRSVKAFEKMGFLVDDVDPGEGLVQLSKSVAP